MTLTTLNRLDATIWPSVDLAFWPLAEDMPAGAAGLRAGERTLFAQVVPAFRWLPTRLFVRASELEGLSGDGGLEIVAAPTVPPEPPTALRVDGEIGHLEVESDRYRVLATPDGSWANKHRSGILCQIQPKFAGSPALLKRNGTLHWGPNLKRPGDHMYQPASLGWSPPSVRVLAAGPFVCEVQLSGPFNEYRGVDAYPDIDVGVVYRFCDRGEWFGVEMDVRFLADHVLDVLRDEEWSFSQWPFTHVVRRTTDGVSVDPLKEMMARDRMLGSGMPWMGFANLDTDLTFASLRLGDKHNGPTSKGCAFSTLGGAAPDTANTYWSRWLIRKEGGKDSGSSQNKGLPVPQGSIYQSRFAIAMIEGADEAAWSTLDALHGELSCGE